jgi:hypothetical protein
MAAIGGQSFNGGDFLSADAGDRRDAGTRRFTVNVYRTRPAQRHSAPEFRARHIQGIAQHPEQRHVGADVHRLRFSVQSKSDGHGGPPKADGYPTTTRE